METSPTSVSLQPLRSSEEKKEDDRVIYVKQAPRPEGPIFHPDYMFCGSCTDCQQPPPGQDAPATAAAPDSLYNHNENGKDLCTQLQLEHHWKSEKHCAVLESLLKPVQGIVSVKVNLNDHTNGSSAVRSTVLVHHDASTTDADLLHTLRAGGYPARIVQRGYAHEAVFGAQDETAGHDDVTIVRSTFYLQGICCSSEVPSVRKIVKQHVVDGVHSLSINITTRRVYVQHDCNTVSAQQLADTWTRYGFPAQILHNGDTEQSHNNLPTHSDVSNVGTSTFQCPQTVLHRTRHSQDSTRPTQN